MTRAIDSREGNQLLAALSSADRQRLQPHLEWVALTAGASLYSAGAPLRHVYFPTTAVISLVSSMRDGATVEVAMVGSEGAAGVCAFMGSREALSSGLVLSAGHAWRIGAQAIAEFARSSDALMQPVLRYLQALFTQIAQTSACNRLHAVEQQLCRWLLLNVDRVESSELKATQERIAHLLGVRREGVTVGAGKLQSAGLIRYDRGRISILDRKGLEQRSCECYSVMRQAQERLRAVPVGAQYHHAERRPYTPEVRQSQAA
ncbi:MAG TPA: Crp/Fnr family transcriptional regulator [Xanthomonadales bacterium]|nr:Crp/Fnr family transcriptional regulator [Xanthomonadales bacterium]